MKPKDAVLVSNSIKVLLIKSQLVYRENTYVRNELCINFGK